MRKKLGKNGGFTLIEMLIVVGIIAILIAVSIPLINNALERSRDATDAANERAAKAEAVLVYMGVGKVDDIDHVDGAFGYHGTYGANEYVRYFYDAGAGKIITDDGLGTPEPYGRCKAVDATCTDEYKNNKNAQAGTASTWQAGTTHEECWLEVNVNADGIVSLEWVDS